MSNVLEVTSTTFKKEVLDAKKPVLVDFWAPWCGPCVAMAPILDELSSELKGKLTIAKMNVDVPENRPTAMTYQIRSIPNMKIFKGGEVVREFIGLRSKEQFVKELGDFLGKTK